VASAWRMEEGELGARLVATGPWSGEALQAAHGEDVVELELNYAKGWKGQGVEFLREVPQIRGLIIADWNIRDISPVHDLHDLRLLRLSTHCKTDLEFSSWPQLEEIYLDVWRAGASSMMDHQGIQRVFINKWGVGRDLESFSSMKRLASLKLYSPSRLESLEGLRDGSRIEELEIARARKLVSLAGLNGMSSLERLEFTNCRGISDVSGVASLTSLKELLVCDCGDIESLAFTRSLRNLESFMFYGTTNVTDGDLSVLEELPRLRKTAFMDRKHYTHSMGSIRLGGERP